MNCITLLSDFGLQDASAASARGILMQYAPQAMLMDISHEVEPFHHQQAAYLLRAAYKNFPTGSCHIILCDVFSEKKPRMLICEKDGHFFLAPDNGILSLAFDNEFGRVWSCYELVPPASFIDWLHAAAKMSADLFAKGPEQLALANCEMKVAPIHLQPIVQYYIIECNVVHIDRYENVVTNLTRQMFDEVGKGRRFWIECVHNDKITELSNYYSDVGKGDSLCRFNSAGFLEIAVNHGNGSGLVGLDMDRAIGKVKKLTEQKIVIYNTVKIHFE